MTLKPVVWLLPIILAACIPSEIRAPVADQQAGVEAIQFGEVSFVELAPGVWQHTTYLDLPGFGPIPSNGLLVVDGETSLLVDTAWTEYQTDQIIRWAAQVQAAPIRAAVVTHFHQDKMGGIAELHKAGIATWASPLTNELAPREGFEPAKNALVFDGNGWATGAGAAAFGPIRIYYPGGAHTKDNITVGLAEIGLAFGGCMIKASNANSLGNLADADTAAYAQSVRNFDAAFPNASTIAMSHSPAEGRKAIKRTLSLAIDLADKL